jgi:hypothetical protein
VLVGMLAKAKYFSQSQSQLTGSSLEKEGKSNLGLAMDRLKWDVLGCKLASGIVVWDWCKLIWFGELV